MALSSNQISLSVNRAVSAEMHEDAESASGFSVSRERFESGVIVAEAREVAASVSEGSVSRFAENRVCN